jgi:multisubunit Na+/H+ antiporter MnhG subunit
MADLPLMTVLGGLLTVPCVIAITQGTEKVTKIFAGVCGFVGLWLGLHRHVDFLRDLTSGTLYQVLGILALVLAVVVAIRLKHQILGTLIITAGGLIALRALDIVN